MCPPDPGRLLTRPAPAVASMVQSFEVVTVQGRAAAVEMRIYSETVEVWHHGLVAGAFNRTELRDWFISPTTRPLADHAAIFSLDRMVDTTGRIAISLPDVAIWTIDPGTVLKLCELV